MLRNEVIDALYRSGGGHYGGALSVLDIVLTLYRKILRVSPQFPCHPERDRFILSKGHATISWYAVLRALGFVDEPLEHYGKFDSPFEGHPDMTRVPGVDFSSGSLGQGLSVGLGMAFGLRDKDARVWVVLGDGECQEGQVWEAAMLASRYRMDNIVAIIDYNKNQEFGWDYDPSLDADPIPLISEKWNAFGWHTMEVDGHNMKQMEQTFKEAMHIQGCPVVIIAHTIKGKGYRLFETDPKRFHCGQISQAERNEINRSLCD